MLPILTMEKTERKLRKKSKQDIPKVPIKTYRWEDVKRSRRKGAYPWTHLDKPPYNDDFDFEAYAMDAFRSKSTSTLGKSDISDFEEKLDFEEAKSLQEKHNLDTEEQIDNPSTKLQQNEGISNKDAIYKTTTLPLPPTTSVERNKDKNKAKSEEPKPKRKLSTGSSSSSKKSFKEKLQSTKCKIHIPGLIKRSKSDASDKNKAKKMKPTKPAATTESKKYKSPKLPTVKDESPVYIHIPLKLPPGVTDEFSKYEFESPPGRSRASSLTKLDRVGSDKRKMSLLGILTELKKVQAEKQKQADAAATAAKSQSNELNLSSEATERSVTPEQVEPKIELLDSIDSAVVTTKDHNKLDIQEIFDSDRSSTKSTEKNKDLELSQNSTEPLVFEPEDSSADDNISQYLDKDEKDEIVSEKSTNVSSDNLSQSLQNKKEENVTQLKPETSVEKGTTSKWNKIQTSSKLQLPQQKERAKSEEPKRKRKLSVDSSYSRKSLSKLAFIKKFKEAKDKIKLPKFPSFKKPVKKKVEIKKPDVIPPPTKATKASTSREVSKVTTPAKPLYIHIPLKLPEGETDEFSHLAEEPIEQKPIKTKKEMLREEDSLDTPETPPATDVQLIFLTAPSDDELLDANIPETPSETDKKFFENLKVDDLKVLAKDVVKTIYPDPKALEPVVEREEDSVSGVFQVQILPQEAEDVEAVKIEEATENVENEQKLESKKIEDVKSEVVEDVKSEVVEETKSESEPVVDEEKKTLEESKTQQKEHQRFIDEEDGLKLSDAAIAMINEEMAKEIIQSDKELESRIEKSPLLKKKVSFKRRSKTDNGERIYEDLELSAESGKNKIVDESVPLKSARLDVTPSMSIDEEKSYLDKKVIKDTSLDEDYNKWSLINDHEYEPVNPPPENTIIAPPPNYIHISLHAPQEVDNKRDFNQTAKTNESYVQKSNDKLNLQEAQKILDNQPISKEKDSKNNQLKPSVTKPTKLGTKNKKESAPPKASAFNTTLRNQADKIKTKFQNIKKAGIKLPQAPKFPSTKLKKPQFKKPNFTMPKMPKRPSLNLPSLGFTRKDSWKNRQLSTESNVSDSTGKIFDFRTYPRIFDKYKKNKPEAPSASNSSATPPRSEFATVPRMNKRGAKQSGQKSPNEDSRKFKDYYDNTKDVIRIPLHSDDEEIDKPSRTRYNEDIDMEDDLEQVDLEIRDEPQFSNEFLRRWDHGEFHEHPHSQEDNNESDNLKPYNSDMEERPVVSTENTDREFSHEKDVHSSGSINERRQGVLEEIDSDEFFLREKGISQENIEVGKYLSSEIREAFRNPVNTLYQFQSEDREYDFEASDQSEPIQTAPKRKPLRKPKRKKTPHVSKEQISFDQESITTEPGEYLKPIGDFKPVSPPSRPKRKSKKMKKKKEPTENIVPYRETIAIEESYQYDIPRTPPQHIEFETIHFILPDNDPRTLMLYENSLQQMYENEHMQGIEQPEIEVSELHDNYEKYQHFQHEIDSFLLADEEPPVAPRRRQRSLKSLTVSEFDSNTDNEVVHSEPQQTAEDYRPEEFIIPTPEPPKRFRRFRSPTLSQSAISQQEDDGTSRGADSLVSDAPIEVEVVEVIEAVEEPCVKQVCDYMGYSVINKSKMPEPPLPPSRFAHSATPPARKKRKSKFSTVPRSSSNGAPLRPLRNYSTLSSTSRPRRSKSNNQQRNKENLDAREYIEIEDEEPVKRLQSGEVIKKMKDRPLPAPPRPPRKSKSVGREILRDISHERNIPTESDLDKMLSDSKSYLDTQSLNEFIQEQNTDISFLSNIEDQIEQFDHEETITHGSLVVLPLNNVHVLPNIELQSVKQNASIERIIPIQQEEDFEVHSKSEVQTDTLTPELGDQKVDTLETPHKLLIIERNLSNQEEDDEETSEIPEEFTKLKDPPSHKVLEEKEPEDEETSEIPEEFHKLKDPVNELGDVTLANQISKQEMHPLPTEFTSLKATNLQVSNLDIDKLKVNELQANKIVVSELDGVSLHVSEINSKSGNLVISGIELPPHVINQMLDQLQSAATQVRASSPSQQDQQQQSTSIHPNHSTVAEVKLDEKKTSTEREEPEDTVNFPPIPPRYDSKADLLDEGLMESIQCEENSQVIYEELIEKSTTVDPPIRPPRKSIQSEKSSQIAEDEIPEPEVLDSSEKPDTKTEDLTQLQPNQESLNSLPQTESSKSEEEPPPRPPQPPLQEQLTYMPSQPPVSFYSLRSPPFIEFIEEDIPLPPRRKRHHKSAPRSRSKSSSDESLPVSRRHHRSSEPSIPQLTGQLVRACATETERSMNRLISNFTNNVLKNADGRQDSHVMILILLIMIAGLILLSCDEKIMVHHHHWEYFNPPKDL